MLLCVLASVVVQASFQSMLDWMGQHSYAMAAQSVINGASGASLRADLKVKSVLVQYIMNGKFDMRDAVTHLQLGPGGAGYATSSVTAGVEAFGAHRELVAELDAVDLSAMGNDTFFFATLCPIRRQGPTRRV